jgi:hypothetical protein
MAGLKIKGKNKLSWVGESGSRLKDAKNIDRT